MRRKLSQTPVLTVTSKHAGSISPVLNSDDQEFIPLREAARIAYGRIENTEFAEELDSIANRNPDDIILLMMTQFTGLGVVFGRKWNARERSVAPLTRSQVRGLKFGNDKDSLVAFHGATPIFHTLEVKQDGIDRVVEYAFEPRRI